VEFLVEFELDIPDGVATSEVEGRERAEAIAADRLAHDGHLIRLWQTSGGTGRPKALGLYRADSRGELDRIFGVLPLREWMHVSITTLAQHPNDPVRT
jgi:muconolactone delta-isomerase